MVFLAFFRSRRIVAEGFRSAIGAIGGATSALISPLLVDQAGGAANLTDADRAMITAIAVLSGGTAAGLLGQNATAAASASENEALNNSDAVHGGAVKPLGDLVSQVCGAGNPPCGDAMIQTLINARASHANQALGTMNAAASYVGGALVGALIGPETIAAFTVNPVLCVNEVSILAGEVYAGLNGMPVEKAASALVGASSAANTAGTGGNVWGLVPTARGVTTESQLAQTEYSAANGWYQVGAENNGYFPAS